MVKTIAQYCIMRWLEINFHLSYLKIEFISQNEARITDRNNETAIVAYESNEVYLREE